MKRFLIENENREDSFITEHASSVLEIISTDWRPVAKVSFAKDRGKDRKEDQIIDIEQFITLKGVSALGNQLTKLKVNQIDLMESLPYEAPLQIPADEIVVVEEEVVDKSDVTETTQQTGTYTDTSLKEKSKEESKASDSDLDINNEGQITLF